MSVTYNNRKQ